MNAMAKIWELMDPAQRRALVRMQLLALLMAFATVGGVAAILPFFTALAEPAASHGRPVLAWLYRQLHFSSDSAFVVFLGCGFVVLALASSAINLLGTLSMSRFAYRVGDTLRSSLLQEYLHRNYAFHLQADSSILANNVLIEIGRVSAGILQAGLMLVANIVTIACILVSLLLLNPLTALLAVLGLGASYVLTYLFARMRLLRNGRRESLEHARRAKLVHESFAAIREILLWRAQPPRVQLFGEYSRAISQTSADTLAVSQIPRHVLESLTVVCLVGAMLLARSGSINPGEWLPQLSFTGLAVYRLLPALQQAFTSLVRMRADRAAFDQVCADLLQARARQRAPLSGGGPGDWDGKLRSNIRLQDVEYRHAAGRAAVLDGVSLDIPAGSRVGLIGANGAGKTTLANIMAGLLRPTSGRILIDGRVLDEHNLDLWRGQIGYVAQDLALLDGSLEQNIVFGVPAAQIDSQRLQTAIRLARLEELVASLPRGLAEIIGERGARLSGGQRQQVGIARALYRATSVLIMDEATNALSMELERELLATLKTLRDRCTVILIAHRISALESCDLILELAAGRLAGIGSYQEFFGGPQPRRAAAPGL